MRSERSLFKIGPFTNHKLNWAALVSTLLVCLVLFTPVRIAFGLIPLSGQQYLIGLGLILPGCEAERFTKLDDREQRQQIGKWIVKVFCTYILIYLGIRHISALAMAVAWVVA